MAPVGSRGHVTAATRGAGYSAYSRRVKRAHATAAARDAGCGAYSRRVKRARATAAASSGCETLLHYDQQSWAEKAKCHTYVQAKFIR